MADELLVEVCFKTGNGYMDHCFAAGPLVAKSDEEVTFCWDGRNETVRQCDVIRIRFFRWTALGRGLAWQEKVYEGEKDHGG